MAERYEFDAPSHVVDLKELENAESDDGWFEARAADGHLNTPLRPDWPVMTSDVLNQPTAIEIPQVKTNVNAEQQARVEDDPLDTPSTSNWPVMRADVLNQPTAIVIPQVNTDVDSGPDPSTAYCPNIVVSFGTETGTDAQPRQTTNQPPVQPRRVSKRKGNSSGSVPLQSAVPPLKKHKLSPDAQPARKSTSVRRRSVRHRNAQLNSKTQPAASNTANSGLSSSEEQELERIRNLQKEVALHRKKNEASYKAALAGNPPPKKTVLSTTVPKEFHFNTDTRVKASTSSSTAFKEVDFISQLRKPSSPVKAKKCATVPKPFNLSTGTKRKMEEPVAYVPMAQQIEQFHKRTPDRYHLRSCRIQERGPSPVKVDHLKLTQPHSPNLMTLQRSRPTTAKSSADLEAEEVDELHKFKFKALELNKKILESAEELKKPTVKDPTVPEGFELQIEKRLHERQASKKPQEEEGKAPAFKSNPVSKKILERVVGVPEKKVLLPTVPESPAFALNKRVRVDHTVKEVKQPSPVKAPAVPHFGLPFQPRLPEHHHVEVCPFSFEEREREKRVLKEKRLEAKQNEEAPQFKAQPLPDFDTVILPEKKKLGPTKPEPFRLLLDERGAVKSSRWEQMVKEEQKQQEEAATFKARPNTVTHKEPFQPKREGRAAVVVEAFKLSTGRRAQERQEYEQLVSEKEALRACMEEDRRREEEHREKEEIARLRQEQVHKAQPIRHYKPVAVKKSEVPLTVPQSPNFSDRVRL